MKTIYVTTGGGASVPSAYRPHGLDYVAVNSPSGANWAEKKGLHQLVQSLSFSWKPG